jgi:hypothetical protein
MAAKRDGAIVEAFHEPGSRIAAILVGQDLG